MTDGGELYNSDEKAMLATLQATLNGLGCDVGQPDGVPRQRTREAALTCRAFAAGEMPDKLNVATLGTFLQLYSRPDVEKLPAGALPEPPEFIIHVAGDGKPAHPDATYDFAALIERSGSDPLPINYLLTGSYDRTTKNFRELSLLTDDDIAPAAAALSLCRNNRIETWGDGGKHLVLNFHRVGDDLELSNFGCVLEALPKTVAEKFAFLVDHFADIAATLVEENSVAEIKNEAVRTFIQRVANDEIKVSAPAL